MPADGLSLTVRVGGKIDHVGLIRRLFQALDDVLLAPDGPVVGLKIVFKINADLALGQIAQVAHAGHDLVVRAQVLANGLGLGRGLHNDQIFCSLFCHSSFLLLCFLDLHGPQVLSHTLSADEAVYFHDRYR